MQAHCIFDMDGLLIDTESIHIRVNNEILARYGLTWTEDIKVKMTGTKERDSATSFVEHYQPLGVPLTVDQYQAERKEKVISRMADCKPLPGVVRLVKHLKANNVPIAIATSSTRFMYNHKAKNNADLFSLFGDHVVCSDDEGIVKGKPHPDLILAGARSLGQFVSTSDDNSHCLVFEDSELGAIAGLRANMRVILVPDEKAVIDPDVLSKCAKVLKSMEDFVPDEFGLPPFPNL